MAKKTKLIPGLELRIARIRAGARQEDVAEQLGVCRQRISQIERAEVVTAVMASRYLDGLTSWAA